MPLDILNFVRKWQQSSLTERSAYQQPSATSARTERLLALNHGRAAKQ